MNTIIERLKRNKTLMVLGVTVNIILFTLFVIGLTVVYGLDYSLGNLWISPDEKQSVMNGKYETILKYCLEHAGDKLNPIDQLMGKESNPLKDLVDKGLVGQHFSGENCGSVKKSYDDL